MIFHLFSLCSGGEYLLQIVDGAIPQVCFQFNMSVPAAQVAVHILDYLYKKLDEVCLVQGGEVVVSFLDTLCVLHLFPFSDFTIQT